MSIKNVYSGTTLAPDNNDPHSWVDFGPTSGTRHDQWSMIRDKSGWFQLKNKTTGQCLDVGSDPDVNESRANEWECSDTNTQQRWYLEPAATSGAYVIRNVKSGGCLSYFHDVDKVVVPSDGSDCNTWPQHLDEWRLGTSSGSTPGLTQIAIRYGLTLCEQDANSCTYSIPGKGQSTAYVDTQSCVENSLVYNGTNEKTDIEVSVADSVGWENTLGGSYTLGSEAGISLEVIEAKVTAAVEASYGHSWIGGTTTMINSHIPVASHEYGWLERGVVAKKVTGTWTFDQGQKTRRGLNPGRPSPPLWTVPTESTAPSSSPAHRRCRPTTADSRNRDPTSVSPAAAAFLFRGRNP
ncbi:RICIN domain-containing protein [Kitasatospora sp. NPDC094028]